MKTEFILKIQASQIICWALAKHHFLCLISCTFTCFLILSSYFFRLCKNTVLDLDCLINLKYLKESSLINKNKIIHETPYCIMVTIVLN